MGVPVSGHPPTAARGVRRAKAAFSSGCKAHPASAPAGSYRSNCGGDETVEAFGKCMSRIGDSVGEQAGTRGNAQQVSENVDAQAGPVTLSGKVDTTGGFSR